MQPAERVAQVDVGHGPLGREIHGDEALVEPRVEVPPRAPHDRVVEVRLRASGHRVLGGAPECEIVGVVERVQARLHALKAEEETKIDAADPPRGAFVASADGNAAK